MNAIPNMENEYNPDAHDWKAEVEYLKSVHSEWLTEILNVAGGSTHEQQIDKLIINLLQWKELAVQVTDALLIAEYMLKDETDKEQVHPGYTDDYKQKIEFALLNARKNFEAARIVYPDRRHIPRDAGER